MRRVPSQSHGASPATWAARWCSGYTSKLFRSLNQQFQVTEWWHNASRTKHWDVRTDCSSGVENPAPDDALTLCRCRGENILADTSEHASKLVLDSPTPQGWKAELT